jgi:hypothetical protein
MLPWPHVSKPNAWVANQSPTDLKPTCNCLIGKRGRVHCRRGLCCRGVRRVGHGFHIVCIIVAPLNRDVSTELAHLFHTLDKLFVVSKSHNVLAKSFIQQESTAGGELNDSFLIILIGRMSTSVSPRIWSASWSKIIASIIGNVLIGNQVLEIVIAENIRSKGESSREAYYTVAKRVSP